MKAERDRKIDEIKKQYEREKEVLKQKNNDLQTKSKNTDAKQTELILSHETNRAKWDQEKSYLISAKDDAIQEMKNIQRKCENQVKDIERLKEQLKKNNWKNNNKERAGGNNQMLYKMGEGVLGRLNLGAGGNLSRPGGGIAELSHSQGNFNLGAGKEGGIGTYRSNLGGVDKSMDNFKLGFGQQYGAQLGTSKFGSGLTGGGQGGAVTLPQPSQSANFTLGMGNLSQTKLGAGNKGELDNSMR
mmetsp:Transcript_11151/g.18720  ORF Transcript_11151/g.18720 Transcript_11151/m.18720 type:complete len:244 (-) Transcript_11151:137-868(-)